MTPESNRPPDLRQTLADWSRWLVPAIVAVALFVPLAFVVAALTPPVDMAALSATFLPEARRFLNPEPVEQVLYLTALLFFPLFFVAWFSWVRQADGVAGGRGRARAGAAGLALLFVSGLGAASGDHFFYWELLTAVHKPWWLAGAVAVALATVALGWKQVTLSAPTRRLLGGTVASTLLLGSFAMGLLPRDDAYVLGVENPHFEVMFDPIVRTHSGAVLLSECANQYGLYPLFLAPVFRFIGLTVPNYSIVMSALVVVALLCLLVAAARGFRHGWVAIATWSAMTIFCFLAVRPWALAFWGRFSPTVTLDPYFQFMPLRVLFPALGLVCAFELTRPVRRGYWRWLGHLALPWGVFWNPETGVVTLGAWWALTGYLSFEDVGPVSWKLRRAARDLLAGIACSAVVAGLFLIGYRIAFGQAPRFELLLRFQKDFGPSGYFALPMVVPHGWMILAFTYVVALAVAARSLVRGGPAVREDGRVLFLGVLGAGLFAYFVGRSHEFNLLGVSFPAVILIGILADRQRLFTETLFGRGLVAFVAAAWILTGVHAFRVLGPEVTSRWRQLEGRAPLVEAEFAFVRERLEGRPAIFLSPMAAVYSLETGSPLATCPSVGELVRFEDLESIARVIRTRRHPVMIDAMLLAQAGIDRDGTRLPEERTPHPTMRMLLEEVERHYTRQDVSPSRAVFLYAPLTKQAASGASP